MRRIEIFPEVLPRFWGKVKRCGDDQCWLWTGAKFYNGYGCMTINKKSYVVSRVSWVIHFGPISSNKFVCHTCDIRLCVNPKHLFLGTALDNMRDKVRKGRQARGSKQGLAKLTENQVIKLRKLYSTGNYSTYDLARRFDCSQHTVQSIVSGQTWRHVANE